MDDDLRLEILMDYANLLPPLPAVYHPLRDAGFNMVEECQSPVFLMIEVRDGLVSIIADVPEEAPTTRSIVSILVQAFDGRPAETVLEAPANLLHALGLSRLLGMVRTRGLTAVYQRVRREVMHKMG